MILAVDLGTTHWKAAVFDPDTGLRHLARIPTPTVEENGWPCYDPRRLLERLRELTDGIPSQVRGGIRAVALSGMAEAGLLVDAKSAEPLTMVWPWFDRRALPVYERLRAQALFADRGGVTGLPNAFKYGIYKLLAMREAGCALEGARWLGLVEYAAFLLTGRMAAEPTLAARTYALDINRRAWDLAFLDALGLPQTLFPALTETGAPMGSLKEGALNLAPGLPVCLCGHDHVCAAHAAATLETGDVFLSMGTAQVILVTRDRFLPQDAASGLSFGPSPVGKPYTCLGSIQSAGGSVNYFKELLYPGQPFETMMEDAARAPAPTGLMYLPYLAGSGAPHLNAGARGGLMGLSPQTRRGEIAAAVYEGIALETRLVLERMGGEAAGFCAMGGLTRHPRLMQILADVTGLAARTPDMDEGTLYGAARLAAQKALGETLLPLADGRVFRPDEERHRAYTNLYQERYLPFSAFVAGTCDAKG